MLEPGLSICVPSVVKGLDLRPVGGGLSEADDDDAQGSSLNDVTGLCCFSSTGPFIFGRSVFFLEIYNPL